MVALVVGQTEQPLLEDRVAAVPQRQTHAQEEMLVAKSGDPIFAPAVGAAARVVVRQVLPGGAILAVILTHRAPLPVADIGPPVSPRGAAPRGFEPASFSGVRGIGPLAWRCAVVSALR